MERVLGTSGVVTAPGCRSRSSDFVIGRTKSTICLTVLDHTRRDFESF